MFQEQDGQVGAAMPEIPRQLRVIGGGKRLSEQEKIKARIKEIWREADEDNTELIAELMIATIRQEEKSRAKWVLSTFIAVVFFALTAQALLMTLFGRVHL